MPVLKQIFLPDDVFHALTNQAKRELLDPRAQASINVQRELQHEGYLSIDVSTLITSTPQALGATHGVE
jgi:hypothetical protein